MAFTAADVKKLREMTDCGMMECKKALTEADGDMDKAVELLREKGLATAAKKAGRVAAEGVCAAYVTPDGSAAGLVEVNIETDFAANNADFRAFAADLAKLAAEKAPADLDEAGFAAYLDSAGIPDPDIIIRSGGEQRTSNFLLWQSAYAEYWFTDTLWPDFRPEDIDAAIAAFGKRERRFGGVK